MKVVASHPEKKHLIKILFDNGSFALIDKTVFEQYPLRPDDSVSQAELKSLQKKSDTERAKQRALYFLDRADQTEKGLFEKLCRAGLSKECCAEVIARFKELGLVDDRRFAENYTERCIEANLSKRAIYSKLLSKGISSELARSVLENTEADELSAINALLEKKYRAKLCDGQNISTVYAALVRRGFSYGAVREAIKGYCDKIEYGEEY